MYKTSLCSRKLAVIAFFLAVCAAGLCLAPAAERIEAKPSNPFADKSSPIAPAKAPGSGKLLLKKRDRLAIVGDSITEQKMYSRLLETYLTVCVPELEITARQFGWSGETAEGFLHRMTNDCLRFQPTVATTCYGMNDYKYRPYDSANALWYREKYTSVIRTFKAAGTRVVLGSPGCVGKVASWVKTASGTLEEHNLHLCALRNIGIEIAEQEKVRFADIFWPMFTAGLEARQRYSPDYAIAGKDGVHPGWSGQLVMAYAYLKAMGLDGDIGTFTVNLKTKKVKASKGHNVDGFEDGELTVTSYRYPFCATGGLDGDNSIRSGMTLVPFNQDLNRLVLKVRGGAGKRCKITWGKESKVYSMEQLAKGVNLAADFPDNPFSEAFNKVEAAVLAKQNFETKQIKEAFQSQEARQDMAAVVSKTESERAPLASAIQAARVPVTHKIKIEAQ
jgi:lysophospholipase L1-like esterase